MEKLLNIFNWIWHLGIALTFISLISIYINPSYNIYFLYLGLSLFAIFSILEFSIYKSIIKKENI